MAVVDRTWIPLFDEEMEYYYGSDSVEWILASELKAYVLNESRPPAATMASRIQEIYQTEFLPADPLTKYLDDRGMESFLTNFYGILFTLARLIPYTSSIGDLLIEIIFELRKLPPLKVKIWEVCAVSIPYIYEP